MHRRVPPTAVTRGSEAGHSTLGYGISRGLLVGSLRLLLVPPSPEDASTVMWLACASTSARRRFDNEAVPANVPSPAPRLMLLRSFAMVALPNESITAMVFPLPVRPRSWSGETL